MIPDKPCLGSAGTGLLPGPVQELHAVDVSDSEVLLSWEPPSDHSNVTDYVIHYNKVDNTSMHETLLKLDNVSLYWLLLLYFIFITTKYSLFLLSILLLIAGIHSCLNGDDHTLSYTD